MSEQADIEELRSAAEESVRRMQDFDTGSLPREAALGEELNFGEVLPAADRLVTLYRRLSVKALGDLPTALLQKIKQRADADFNLFSQALDFKASVANASEERHKIIASIKAAYDQAFSALQSWISYGASVTVDFTRLETEARAAMQTVKDEGAALREELVGLRDEALGVLADIRRVAAEHGVTQQAEYFKEEAGRHDSKGTQWRKLTYWLALALGLYSVGSLFIQNIPVLKPENTYQTVQLATSKILIFAVLSYVLFLAARNFLAHEHNAIVNRHRQNALLRFKALVDAAKADEAQDIVLSHAAACIFAPQETGYAKFGGPEGSGPTSRIVELLPRPSVRVGSVDS